MKYNFDEVIDRRGSYSAKWLSSTLVEKFGSDDVIPMWIADMDFRAPDEIVDVMVQTAKHGIYGYVTRLETHYDSFIKWMESRHGWKIKSNDCIHCPGIVSALAFLTRIFTSPGDKVIVQTPVYYPFREVSVNNGRIVVNNELKEIDGHYFMDFEDLAEKAKDPRTRLLILCSPHNPVGRVWTRSELERLGEICEKNNVLIIADEIHGDIVYKGHKFIPFASISEKFAQNSVTCTAPSKTFNMAGLQASVLIIQNPERFNMVNTYMTNIGIIRNNVFSIAAFQAAYEHGQEWLSQYLEYMEGNLEFLKEYIKKRIPQIKVIEPEGTYLIWLDCRALGFKDGELSEFLSLKAKVALDPGFWFSDNTEGFARMNISCPRAILESALERIRSAVAEYCEAR